MLRFSALVPDATVNYVKNPSVRYDTTDWNASGATLTRTLDFARFGIASLKVVTAGTALRQGAYYRVSGLNGVSEPITVSAYVRGTGKVRIRLINNPTGMEWSSISIQLEAGYWQRITVSGFSTGSNDLRLYVETDDQAATVRTFYIDGAQMERKSYPTTYCDGDQPGCRWNGLYHASTSQRAGDTREGGRWVQLAGAERESQDLYMTVATGLGKAPITNNIHTFALEAGAYFQNKKIEARPIALTFHAKHKVDDSESPVSLAALHQLRQLLIDIVKPDRTGGDEEIWFEYFDGNTPLYFQARYNGGLEGEWDIRNQFVNSFPLRLLAVSPLLLEDSQESQALDFQETLVTNRAAGRINGRWTNLNYGFNDTVNKFARGTRGEIYATGVFTQANSNALAINPNISALRIAYWDGEKWTALGTGLNAAGQDVAVAPNGDVYVVGDFTTAGGGAAVRAAKWNGSAWSALGTGLNGQAVCVLVAPNGDVIVGGTFTSAGGVTVANIARWDGLQWRRLGQYGGLNAIVRSLAMSPDGSTLFVSGDFTDQNGNPGSGIAYVAQYNMTTGLFSAMGTQIDAAARSLFLDTSGLVYAGGVFTVPSVGMAKWNGGSWLTIGSGFQTPGSAVVPTVLDMNITSKSELLVVGSFDYAGGHIARKMAIWNGSTLVGLDAEVPDIVPSALLINGCLVDQVNDDDLYIGFNLSASTRTSGLTVVTNPGSAEIRPVIYVRGPGTLRWIENQTTQKRIYLDMTLLSGEEVFFDFGRGRVESTIRGSLFYAILAGSDFRSFSLIPGDNTIATFMVNDVDALMYISLRPTHWSADATQHGESL